MVNSFNSLLPDFNVTKCFALFLCSKIYDPTIHGKLLIGDLWKLQVYWKEDNDSILHNFYDASNEAYFCVVYVVSGLGSNILMSKSRVAPMKAKTTHIEVSVNEIVTQDVPVEPLQTLFPVENYSSLSKLMSVTDVIFNFIAKVRGDESQPYNS